MTSADQRPLFRQIVDGVKAQISAGELTAHAALPSERVLALDYNVSRMTARRALEAIEAEGLAYSKTRQGRFVSPSRINYDLSSMEDFVSWAASNAVGITVQLLSSQIIRASAEQSEILGTPVESALLQNQRLFHRDDHTVFLETETILPEQGKAHVPGAHKLSEKELREHRYSALGHTADIVIRMRPLRSAEAHLLGVTPYQLGIEQIQLVKDEAGNPFCNCQQIWRGELAQFSATAMLK